MLSFVADSFMDFMQRGGVVMWALLALSLTGVTLASERCWFWVNTNRRARVAVGRMAQLLRNGQFEQARGLADNDASVYGRLICRILDEPGSVAAAADAVETQRPRLERFMPTLSTIITAAPMLGILGTVVGLISALRVFGTEQAVTDPRLVSPAIGEALITTAAGLVVALVVLFPYNAFRAQVDRTLGRIDTLTAAILQGQGRNVGCAAESVERRA